MKSRNARDYKRRVKVLRDESKRLLLKSNLYNTTLSYDERISSGMNLSDLSKNGSKVRIKNRCVLTGRSHGIVSSFKISRIMFRQLALDGMLPGVSKSSW